MSSVTPRAAFAEKRAGAPKHAHKAHAAKQKAESETHDAPDQALKRKLKKQKHTDEQSHVAHADVPDRTEGEDASADEIEETCVITLRYCLEHFCLK